MSELMKKLFLAAVLALLAPAAFADSVTVTWTAPTQNTNGTAIPATGSGSIASTRVEWGSCSGTAFGTKAGELVVLAPATSATIPSVPVATTVCVRAFAKNTYGVESAASNIASKQIPAPTPEAPVLGATITLAYEILPSHLDGARLGRAVGTVVIGTQCQGDPIATQKGEFYQVPLESVTLTKEPKSSVLVTQCAAS